MNDPYGGSYDDFGGGPPLRGGGGAMGPGRDSYMDNPGTNFGAAPGGPPGGVGQYIEHGPFMKPLFNKLVRALSFCVSLIGIILEMALLAQGIASSVAASKNASKSNAKDASGTSNKSTDASEEEEDDSPDAGTTSRRKKTVTETVDPDNKSSDPTTELLGEETTRLVKRMTEPTQRLIKKAMLNERAESTKSAKATPTPAPVPENQYVPNSDVPSRTGAIGFTILSHLLIVALLCFFCYLEYLLLVKKPATFGYWTPLIIAIVQLALALDVLGRFLSPAAQAGAYIMLLLAITNCFFAGWTVLHAKRNGAAAKVSTVAEAAPPPPGGMDPYGSGGGFGGPDDGMSIGGDGGDGGGGLYTGEKFDTGVPMMDDPMVDDLMMEGTGGMTGTDMPPNAEDKAHALEASLAAENQSLDSPKTDGASEKQHRRHSHKHKRHRRKRAPSFVNEDIDSYYERSPPIYRSSAPPPPNSRRASHAYGYEPTAPPAAHRADHAVASSPISLYGPQDSRRILEQQRRLRRRSLSQPAQQFDPSTGAHVQPASRFGERAIQPVLEDTEEAEDLDAVRLRPNDPRLSRDGFANRTRVAKKLQII